MDRRQKKTRNAIFHSFISLLSEKSYERITVEQIISRADIGRATFYAHFETKEYLLKALCGELFAHIIEVANGESSSHNHIFDCNSGDSVFLHLFRHLRENDNNILLLLSGENNDLFLPYFKEELLRLAESQRPLFENRKPCALPDDFWTDHIASTFVETLRWWLSKAPSLPPETIAEYFFLAV